MKFNIISDLHVDINWAYDFNIPKDVFTIICGDTAGNVHTTADFYKKYIKQGVAVAGNHLGYSCEPPIVTRDQSIEFLKSTFQEDFKFLECDTYTIDDYVIAGCTLFTDFEAYNKRWYCMNLAACRLNDFSCVRTRHNNQIVKLTPAKTVEIFKKSVQFLTDTLKENPNKKVIFVTHHAPSLNSIAPEHLEDLLSAAYCSDLEYLTEYPNLKLWCHGHTHTDFDYMINGTRVICNPFGYGAENNKDPNNISKIVEI